MTAVESNADATAEQIANARAEGNAALDALRAIIRASGVANAATTPAAAEGAVASARAALSDPEKRAIFSGGHPERRVEAVANLREQEAEEDRLATNGSSLIQHVRDNRESIRCGSGKFLGAGSITVGAMSVGETRYHLSLSHRRLTPTVYPRTGKIQRGIVRKVTITVGGGGSALFHRPARRLNLLERDASLTALT